MASKAEEISCHIWYLLWLDLPSNTALGYKFSWKKILDKTLSSNTLFLYLHLVWKGATLHEKQSNVTLLLDIMCNSFSAHIHWATRHLKLLSFTFENPMIIHIVHDYMQKVLSYAMLLCPQRSIRILLCIILLMLPSLLRSKLRQHNPPRLP